MKATISWWCLDKSTQTIDSLRAYLQEEGVAPWEGIPGMHSKFWISDPASNLWGAVVVWESADAMKQPLPPNRAMELIGYAPTLRATFNVEVLVENGSDAHGLADLAKRTCEPDARLRERREQLIWT